MSYATVAAIRQDPWVRDRVGACIALEALPARPEDWAVEHAWELASQPGWAAAWEAGVAAHPDDADYLPGADETVITDAMILDAVQSLNGTSA